MAPHLPGFVITYVAGDACRINETFPPITVLVQAPNKNGIHLFQCEEAASVQAPQATGQGKAVGSCPLGGSKGREKLGTLLFLKESWGTLGTHRK